MKKTVWALIVLLAVLHLALAIPAVRYPERLVVADSQQYMDLANGMLQMGRFVSQSDPTLDFLRTPGYPVFLVLIKALFTDFRWASLLQVFVLFLNSVILYRMAIELACPKMVGYTAALLYLLNLNAAFVALRILTETLTALWLLLALWMLVRFWNTRRHNWLILSGLIMGVAALTRPSCYPLFIIWIVLLIGLLAFTEKKKFWHTDILHPAIIFFISGFVLVFSWQVRNLLVHDAFTLSPIGRTTFKNWVIAESMAETYGITREDAKTLLNKAPDMNAFIVDYMRQNPVAFTKTTVRGVLYSLLAVEYPYWAFNLTGVPFMPKGLIARFRSDLGSFLDNPPIANVGVLLGLFALLFDAIVYGLAALASWRIFIKRESDPRLLAFYVILLVTFAYTVLTPLGHGAPRFRAPVEPFLMFMAALAFNQKRVEPKVTL